MHVHLCPKVLVCMRARTLCVCVCVKYNIQTIRVRSICKVFKVNISGFPVPLHLFKTSSCQSFKWIIQIRTCLMSLQPTRFKLYKLYQYAEAFKRWMLVSQCHYISSKLLLANHSNGWYKVRTCFSHKSLVIKLMYIFLYGTLYGVWNKHYIRTGIICL